MGHFLINQGIKSHCAMHMQRLSSNPVPNRWVRSPSFQAFHSQQLLHRWWGMTIDVAWSDPWGFDRIEHIHAACTSHSDSYSSHLYHTILYEHGKWIRWKNQSENQNTHNKNLSKSVSCLHGRFCPWWWGLSMVELLVFLHSASLMDMYKKPFLVGRLRP